ncbi:MAG: universal stress protein [Desulfobacterales bacterium]|jgi:nucleotide-binding universal stress UspA family protein|nr:universal stress protein [Desulfobacterales bacterium]
MKILVAFDGTKEARKAVEVAVAHAKAFGAGIVLAHSMVGGPEIPRKEFEDAERALKHQEVLITAEGVPCESVLSVRGMEAGEDLVQLAEERKADEIIIGIQRKSKVGKLLFGSTAQYVVMRAPCPVVTVQ